MGSRLRQFVKRYRVVLGVGLLALLAMLAIIVGTRQFASSDPQVVPISDLLSRVEHDQIDKVEIAGDLVIATDKSGHRYQAFKESNQAVSEEIRQRGVEVSVVGQQPNYASTGLVALLPLAVIGGVLFAASRHGGMNNQALSFGRSRARVTLGDRPSVTFNDVAGVEEAKAELAEVVQFLKSPEKYQRLGARIPRGVLLVGPPGTGKTLLARAVAGEAGVPFFSISGSEFVEMFVGVGASRVRDLFRQAKRNAPCIVFVDEIDAVGRHRGGSLGGANDEREQTLNQLLVEMDGFDSSTGVIVIAATNRPDVLDAALLRPGRFDRQVVLDAPDLQGRLAILQVHARGKPLHEDVKLEELARQTAGFSGADLANLINEAAILAAREDRQFIEADHLEESILRVLAGPQARSRVLSDKEKRITAYHEVGHALVMRSMPDADPINKVSIISRGRALGLTVQASQTDRYLVSQSQLKSRMAGAMGGRAAELIIFGDVTNGAQQDIEHVTNIARKMVCEFGMSPLGTISLKQHQEPFHETFSDQTAARVDEAIAALIDEALQTACQVLQEKRDKLVQIAERLIEVETLDGEELEALLNDPA